MKKSLLISSLLLGSTLFATQYQDTFKTVVKETPEVKKAYYEDGNYKLHSPAFNKKWSENSKFTSYNEMMNFLDGIVSSNDWATLHYFGKSQENRKIPYLILSNGKKDEKKAKVWLQGGIHGNEPAGTEGMLALLGYMNKNQKETKKWLDSMDILVVPRFNVDGTEYFQRRTARNIDLNRDHVKLEVPEMLLVKKVFNEFKPQVIIDNHEYTPYKSKFKKLSTKGYAMSQDVTFASARNLNLDKSVRQLADDLYIGDMKKVLDKNSLSHEVYVTGSVKKGKMVFSEGGTVARIGRNAAGLTNAVSILLETRGIGLGGQNFPRRVQSQLLSNISVLNTTMNNKEKLVNTINSAIKKVIEDGKNGTNDIIVKSTRTKGSKNMDLLDIGSNKVVNLNVVYKYSSKEKATLTRKRPKAYIIPPAFNYVTKKLETLGLKVNRLDKKQALMVESYEVVSNKPSKKLYEGEFRNNIKTKLFSRIVDFPKGTAIVPMAQKNANLLMLALEPESSDSYATFNIIPVQKGDEYPIFRYHGKL